MEAPDTAEGGGDDSKGGKENMKELYTKLREMWPEYVKGKANTPGSNAAAAATATATATTTTTAAAATTTAATSAPTATATTTTAAA